MAVYAIAAMDNNRGIGFRGSLPWHYPEDLKLFKSLTNGSGLVMGRKTFDSLGGLLPNRGHYVVSRQKKTIRNVVVHCSLKAAVEASNSRYPNTFIIGGAEIYSQCYPLINAFYLTRIEKVHEVDVYLPRFPDHFKIKSRIKLMDGLYFEIYKA